MSRDFNGAANVLVSGASITLGTVFSLVCRAKPRSAGGNSLGFMVTVGPTTIPRFTLFMASATQFQFFHKMVTTGGLWKTTNAVFTAGLWTTCGVTYDCGSVANDPILYADGVAVPVTESTTPVGAALQDVAAIYIGGASTTDRGFDGLLGEVAIYGAILTPAEMAAIHVLGVLAGPAPMVYAPFDGASVQTFGTVGATWTVTGATAAENPPTRPAGRRG